MSGGDNRNAQATNDEWLTPPEVVKALGSFQTDPCCPPKMPWRTAKKMYGHKARAGSNVIKADGLEVDWKGYTLVNSPWSEPLPWVRKMAEHGNGVLVLPAKSPESRWGQLTWATADAVLLPRQRLLFHYPSGKVSTGRWSPNLFAAYGSEAERGLKRLQQGPCPGVFVILRGNRETSRSTLEWLGFTAMEKLGYNA